MRKNWGENSQMNLPDLLPEVKDFLKRLIGPSADELGLLFGEKLRFLRLKSSIKVYNRAKDYSKKLAFLNQNLLTLRP
jgi:hypothetical protein